MEARYNMRSPAVKRLMKEAQELNEPTEQYFAEPLEDNLFEWHFTIRGPSDSEFEGGIYHGRIILPPDYPMKPPSIMMLTPNGRFEILKKICLSISGHHPESWQPSWSIRTALLAIIGFMPTHGSGAIGSLDYTPEERKVLAKKSQDWKCPTCGNVHNVLKPVTEASEKTKQEAKELASQINFQGEKEKKDDSSSASGGESGASSGVTSEPKSPSPDGASATPPSSVPSPPMFPWPGMPPFPPGSTNGQQMPAFPFPPPFAMPPDWQQRMHMNRFPPSPMSQTYTGPFNPNMMSWFPQHAQAHAQAHANAQAQGQAHVQAHANVHAQSQHGQSSRPGQTDTTDSSSRPKMSAVTQQVSSTTATTSTQSTSQTAQSQTNTHTATTTAATAGLRQRQPAARPAATEPAPTFEPEPEQVAQGGIVSSGLMLVLGLAILALLIRRLYLMDVLK